MSEKKLPRSNVLALGSQSEVMEKVIFLELTAKRASEMMKQKNPIVAVTKRNSDKEPLRNKIVTKEM